MFSPDSPKLIDKFGEFLRDYYEDEVGQLALRYPKTQRSLWIDHSDVFEFDPDLADDLIERPQIMLESMEEAVRRMDLPTTNELGKVNIRIEGLPTTLNPSELDSSLINSYVAVSGQLTRVTQKRPFLRVAEWECQRCGTTSRIPQARNEVQEPHECQGCERQGPFKLNENSSEFVDQRKIKLEEPIEERTQTEGASIPVYVQDDLVDYAPGSSRLPDHAGEHATIEGVLRIDDSKLNTKNGGAPETTLWLDAKAINFDADVEENIDVSEHREAFEEIAVRDDAADLVAESLAPSLSAEEGDDLYVARRACAAWLFNGYRIDPDGAESKRGDMHMALIGDPGTGKSTLMSYCHKVLPKSEYRTGPGLTKVGLTAAAVQEEFAGESEWTLQPGVLPRADGGHCLIDEVDAIVDENTKAIHDALEGEQLVKADKAGITADLPTRCALLAGGNPKETRFNRMEPITEQIDLDPALFDRMDLVFSLQDAVDEYRDETKARHTVEAFDELTKVDRGNLSLDEADVTEGPVPKEVLRAWIRYARENVFPLLTAEAKEALIDYYVDVRNLNDGHSGNDDAAVPATMRTLESAIRLAISFARLRLSETVEIEDAERAIDLSKHVVGLRFDPETGEFDDRMTASGETKSQKSRREQVIHAILQLQDEGDEDGAAMADLKAEVDAEGRKVEHDVEELIQAKQIYEPRTGYYRKV